MEKIEKDNRLIAEFMGGVIIPSEKHEGLEELICPPNDVGEEYIICPFHDSEIRYDTSWDWLMPVVEKIKEIQTPQSKFDLNIDITGYTTFRIYSENYPIHILVCEITKGIETVHKVVVEFIKWYNKK